MKRLNRLCLVLEVQTSNGPVVQLVSTPPCHGGGRGFESLLGRLIQKCIKIMEYGRLAQLGEHLPYKQGVIGSSPIATMCRYGSIGRAADL